MAITPKSFLRSPMLLVAALLSAGGLFVGACVLLSAMYCSAAQERVVFHTERAPLPMPAAEGLAAGTSCAHLADGVESTWPEFKWVRVAACLESSEHHSRAVTVAATGLGYYPASEALHNIRGYNLIAQRKYAHAVAALRTGLKSVTPTTGTLENNLAWAGLFAPHTMTLGEARQHYRNALEKEATCEILHTGLWVEYGLASTGRGAQTDDAVAAYDRLRPEYQGCEERMTSLDESTIYEVLGAGILDAEMAKIRMTRDLEAHSWPQVHANFGTTFIRSSVALLGDDASASEVCAEAAPLRSAFPACRRALASHGF